MENNNTVYKAPSGKYFVSVRKCNRTVFGGTFASRRQALQKARELRTLKQAVPKKIVCMY